jgi:hypothetical protein
MHEKQWSVQHFGLDGFGPCSALRQAMLEETALISGLGIVYPVFSEAQPVSLLCGLLMCKLRNRVHGARGAVGALQPGI